MKTWIVCINKNGAMVLSSDESDDGVNVSKTFQDHGQGVSSELAEALESRFDSSDAPARLVVCGEPKMVSALCAGLSDHVRNRIVGIVPVNLAKRSLEFISACARKAASGKYLAPHVLPAVTAS